MTTVTVCRTVGGATSPDRQDEPMLTQTAVTYLAGMPEARTSYGNQRGIAARDLGGATLCLHGATLDDGCRLCRASGCVLLDPAALAGAMSEQSAAANTETEPARVEPSYPGDGIGDGEPVCAVYDTPPAGHVPALLTVDATLTCCGTRPASMLDGDLGVVPATVNVDGVDRPVLAAAFLPPAPATLAAHVVLYRADDADDYAVGLLMHDDDEQRSYLTDGEYDLTFDEAFAAFADRLAPYASRATALGRRR